MPHCYNKEGAIQNSKHRRQQEKSAEASHNFACTLTNAIRGRTLLMITHGLVAKPAYKLDTRHHDSKNKSGP
jgi:hypothetical protein